jgi:primosomal protein N' (replication factor Y)
MDLDTMKHRLAFIDAWNRIQKGDVDIILGTQMVAKGFHLEQVNLVGVPLADVSLFQPDFRSAERAFSLLTQVAGRAGRGKRRGKVLIQSYVPYHYAIQYAQTHDYRGFYDKEVRVRQVLRFPPHFRLISVLATGKSVDTTRSVMKSFCDHLRNAAFRHGNAITVLGPAPAPIEKIQDMYRWRVLIRGIDHKLMKLVLQKALDRQSEVPGKSRVRLTIDVDPLDLL